MGAFAGRGGRIVRFLAGFDPKTATSWPGAHGIATSTGRGGHRSGRARRTVTRLPSDAAGSPAEAPPVGGEPRVDPPGPDRGHGCQDQSAREPIDTMRRGKKGFADGFVSPEPPRPGEELSFGRSWALRIDGFFEEPLALTVREFFLDPGEGHDVEAVASPAIQEPGRRNAGPAGVVVHECSHEPTIALPGEPCLTSRRPARGSPPLTAGLSCHDDVPSPAAGPWSRTAWCPSTRESPARWR